MTRKRFSQIIIDNDFCSYCELYCKHGYITRVHIVKQYYGLNLSIARDIVRKCGSIPPVLQILSGRVVRICNRARNNVHEQQSLELSL